MKNLIKNNKKLIILSIVILSLLTAAVFVPIGYHQAQAEEPSLNAFGDYDGTSRNCKTHERAMQGFLWLELTKTIGGQNSIEDGEYIYDDVEYESGFVRDYMGLSNEFVLDSVQLEKINTSSYLEIDTDEMYYYWDHIDRDVGVTDQYVICTAYNSNDIWNTEVRSIVRKDCDKNWIRLKDEAVYDTIKFEVIHHWGVQEGDYQIDVSTSGRAACYTSYPALIKLNDDEATFSHSEKYFEIANLMGLADCDYIFEDWKYSGDCIRVGKNNQQKIDYIQYFWTGDTPWIFVDAEEDNACDLTISSSYVQMFSKTLKLGGKDGKDSIALDNPPKYDRISFE